MDLIDVSRLGDDALVAGLRRLVEAEHAVTARVLLHLGEMDARRLYRERACSSMFAYAVEELHMSEPEAYLRIQAARLGREFPLIVEMLGRGELHLTAIKLLAPHLTQHNHASLLERARGKSKRAVELLVAEYAPKPDVPSRMRKLPERRNAAALRAEHAQISAAYSAEQALVLVRDEQASLVSAAGADDARREVLQPRTHVTCEQPFELTVVPPPRRASSTPLSPGRYKVELTAGQALHDKLEQLKDLLRHQVPDGDLAIVVERAADLLIEKLMKDRFGQMRAKKQPRAKRPRKRRPPVRARATHSRYVRRAVLREVYERDGGQCAFVTRDGRRCSERGFLELHHQTPFARGGPTTASNLKLICRAHNALFADRDYGQSFMQTKLLEARAQRRQASSARVPEQRQT